MITWVLEVLASLVDSVICVHFVMKFNHSNWKKSKFAMPAIIGIWLVTLLTDYYLSNYDVLSTLILFGLSIGYALTISNKQWIRAVVSASIFKIAVIVLTSSIFSIFSFIVDDFSVLMSDSGVPIRYLAIALQKLALFTTLRLVLYFDNETDRLEPQNGILTFLFSLITIIGLGAVMTIMNTQTRDYYSQLLVIVIAFLVLNVFMYVLLNRVVKLQKSKYDFKLLQEKIRYEETRYQDVLEIWERAKKMRHEYSHHMTAIVGLLEAREIDKCYQYAQDCLQEAEPTRRYIQSGNTVLDYLINSKLTVLENTEVIISGSAGNWDDIRDTDLASLIGNIIDNAVEAVEHQKEKHIELLFSIQNGHRMIICKNNITNSVLAENRELRTTKKETSIHGFGHHIVSEIVEKYHGMVDYFEDRDMFGVQIMLPISKDDQSLYH